MARKDFKMSFAKKYNKNNVYNFKFDESTEYITLKELCENNVEYLRLNGFYKNRNSKFGKNYVAVCDKWLINLPKHMNETIEEINKDVEAIADINDGKVGIKPYQYNKENKACYSINFIDL